MSDLPILPAPTGTAGLSASIEQHLRAYFAALGTGAPADQLYAQILREVEMPLLTLTLERCQGNQLRAAALLGLNRNTLRKKLRALGLLAPAARVRRRKSVLSAPKRKKK